VCAVLALLVALSAMAMTRKPATLKRDASPAPRAMQVPQALQIPRPTDIESMLVKTLLEVQQNHLDVAMKDIEARLSLYPNFKLAHLIKGDLLMARARPLSTIGSAAGGPPQQVSDLREEARARLLRHLEEMPLNRVPKYLVQFQPEQHHAIVVDTGKSRLYVYENDNGVPRYLADYYISSGKAGSEKNREGDQKTPLGVYFVTANLPKKQISDFYGNGAFPISYPNEWDRQQGKDGSGIWLHGVPSDTYSRPPRASNGCVVLSNPDLDVVAKYLQVGLTPVVISDNVEWSDPRDVATQRSDLVQRVESWRHDWESINTDKYLQHYSRDFQTTGYNLQSWGEQKRQVNSGKSWIKIKLSNVSIFNYPGNENLMVITFDQDYSSNNLSNKMKKRQYWKFDNKEWKIVYEGAA
jgi:murein L,D-transpeptidase YafK